MILYNQSLANLPRLSAPIFNADMIINGANSSPMFGLLRSGQSSVWTSGDLGRSYNQAWGGKAAVGQIGIAHAVSDGLILRFAAGTTFANETLYPGGNSRLRAAYLVPEATVAVYRNLYATLTGFTSWGSETNNRAYVNGTSVSMSSGAASTQTYGFRLRVDWVNAYRLMGTDLSPYASVTHTTTHVGGYTEYGGTAPAYINGGSENSDIVRIGSDAVYPLAPWFALIGRAEYAHRFQSADATTSGEILGLTGFAVAGTPLRQDWVRGGLGVKAALGPGEGYLMMNVSNQSVGATYWLNASYRIVF